MTEAMFVVKLILFVIVGTPLLMVLIGVYSYQRERRALQAAVRTQCCPSCSEALSERSIQLADELWQRHMATIMAKNPNIKLRVVRHLSAVCDACGAQLTFDPSTSTLRALAEGQRI